jgi:hypothetical protein
MHHLLTGRDPQLEPPFSFPPLKTLAPQVSSHTDQVVMRALERDVEKRPRSAREMRDLLPEPAPDDAALAGAAPSAELNAARPGAPAMSAMATIVLNRPVPSSASSSASGSSRAVSANNVVLPPPAPRVPKANPGAMLQTQRSLSLPRSVAPAPKAFPPAAKSVIPPKSSSANGPAPAINRVSSTAKTADLGLKKAQNAAAPSSRGRPAALAAQSRSDASTSPHRTSPATVPDPRPVASIDLAQPSLLTPGVHPALRQSPAPAGQRNGHAAPGSQVIGGARLVAVSEGTQFDLDGGRAVIGRSNAPGAEAIDIDLSRLARGVDRVSRRHAEIIKRGADYFIRDLGSLNGTYIAGRGKLGRDQLYRLNDRDEIVLGGAKLEFRKG